MLPVRMWLAVLLSLACLPLATAHAAVQSGTYAWPVRGPVIRPYEAPSSPYGSGHRGIDIAAPFGTSMVAAQDGVVAFAGWVAGALYISIDHPDGVRTTYSWLSAVSVKKGDLVAREQVIGNTGHGDPDESTPCLHFGARIGRTYIDPMTLLEPGDVVGLIHLGPLDEGSPPSPSFTGNHAA
jgi:murein DD-endopeptidase MepM/ murein hydrolase activator NlpD